MGAFDHLEWTYDGAFEQLSGLGRGEFSKNFPKIQMPGGLPGGDVEASIWLVHYITEDKIEITNSFTYLEVKFSTNGTLLKKWSLYLGENQF